VTNLIKNAIQATKDRENPKIRVAIDEVGENIRIRFKDNGEGISEDNKELIFEPRFTTKTSGMGLGLGIIKQIVENYKGNIYFESTINQGTTFTVEIPKK